jgi:hypothetical protein
VPGVVNQWEKEDAQRGHRKVNIIQYCVHMYENEKMRPAETILGMGVEEIKENDGEGEFNYGVS